MSVEWEIRTLRGDVDRLQRELKAEREKKLGERVALLEQQLKELLETRRAT